MKSKATLGLILALLLAIAPVCSLSSTNGSKDVVVLNSNNTIVLNSEMDGDSVSKVIEQAKN